jgi:NitT/TauT family transport system permease protein
LQASDHKEKFTAVLYPTLGIAGGVFVWYCITAFVLRNQQFGQALSPVPVFQALFGLLVNDTFPQHILPSLMRVLMGLSIAFGVGVPIGLLVGYFQSLNKTTYPLFQFIRMISPLAWMPFAVMMFGVGSNAVVFLIAIAAVWPMILNTAHGVQSINPMWTKVVRMVGGNDSDILWRAVIPAVIPDILAGLRIALGMSWIVLVPAEMLGVPSGLGYFILDARDRFNYSELGAVILVVGFLGFVSDYLIRSLQRRLSWRTITDTLPAQ